MFFLHLIDTLLTQQTSAQRNAFIAQTLNPPRHIEGPGEVQRQFGFNEAGRIDVFDIGGKSADQRPFDPNAMNLDALNFEKRTLPTPQSFGFSESLCKAYQVIKDLVLLYTLCKRAKLVPGISREIDEKIATMLWHNLSDNITNKQAVVEYFVKSWNNFATSRALAKGLELPQQKRQEGSNTIFVFHNFFTNYVKGIIHLCAYSFQKSPIFQKLLPYVVQVNDGASLEEVKNALYKQVVPATTVALLSPGPLELNTIEQTMNIIAQIYQLVTGATFVPKQIEYPLQKLAVIHQFNQEREFENPDARRDRYAKSPSKERKDVLSDSDSDEKRKSPARGKYRKGSSLDI